MDLWKSIEANLMWSNLQPELRAQMNNDCRVYEEHIVVHSFRNQLRYNKNIVRFVLKREKKYYEKLMEYGRTNYFLYPYHLQDKVVKGLKITPFFYYKSILVDTIAGEQSYDCMPNFTAADCLRLLGIGRNQYIEVMNAYKSHLSLVGLEKSDREKLLYDMLPGQPIESILLEPWYVVNIGHVLVSDIESSVEIEKKVIDKLIDVETNTNNNRYHHYYANKDSNHAILVCDIDSAVLRNLYRRGLVYIDVPIKVDDRICVPTLEGFVMNRISGDTRENLLYKVFVTIDGNTSIGELADCLQVDVDLVKEAASLFCRLGFAHKTNRNSTTSITTTTSVFPNVIVESGPPTTQLHATTITTTAAVDGQTTLRKKLALIFDSTITAYLMMGNLSSSLKPHAVTMFEVGKLSEQSLNSFQAELDHLTLVDEGEAKLYHEHAINLRETIRFLRQQASVDETDFIDIDLIRGGSLLNLEPETRSRILNKNYSVIVSLIPSTFEDQQVFDIQWPVHLGPPCSLATSPWFGLYVSCAASGAMIANNEQRGVKTVVLPAMLLQCGKRVHSLPNCFLGISYFWLTAWGHEAVLTDAINFLSVLNDMLLASSVLVQAIDLYSLNSNFSRRYIPLPLSKNYMSQPAENIPHFLINLSKHFNLTTITGYIVVLGPQSTQHNSADPYDDECQTSLENALLTEADLQLYWQTTSHTLFFISLHLGLPIFNSYLNKAVCNQIQSAGLLYDKEELASSNNRLVDQLNAFIFEHCSGLTPNRSSSNGTVVPDAWPLPTCGWICSSGRLESL